VAGLAGFAGADQAAGGGRRAADAVDHVGRPSHAHLEYAHRLMESLPAAVVRAAHEPHGARAVIYALVLDRDPGTATRQLLHLRTAADAGVYEETGRLAPLVAGLDVRARLPLVEITLPALRALTSSQYDRFTRNLDELVRADEAIDLFEWALQRILLHDLEAQHARVVPRPIQHRTLGSVKSQSELLISVLAYAGHRDAAAARMAFDEARQSLGIQDARLCPPEACGLDALDAALDALEGAAPLVKRQILRAAAAGIAADRTVTPAEAELLRAISASLGCPMPPILPGGPA
jgi:hypothetical protein